MELNINSPAYYTKLYGIDEEIYNMCREISKYVKGKKYSELIDVIGIVPIIAPKEELDKGLWKEMKKCEIKYRFASVSLHIDYQKYVDANNAVRKKLIIQNILESVKSISKRGKFDYSLFESDIKDFCNNNSIIII